MTEPVEELSFEEALSELETIVERLESEGLTLETTMTLYQRGRALSQRCQHLLDAAELRVQQITAEGGADAEPVPFVPEDVEP
ncbi:MAG: exodeoxyribonuclease VII small subunit [Anaerolineae bacterium]